MNGKTSHEITWLTVGAEKFYKTIPVNAKSLVDIGCGYGLTGFFCRAYRNMDRTVGIDGFQDYIKFCAKHNLYDDIKLMDLNQTYGLLPFSDSEFDVAFCSEVVEHLPKNVALGLNR